MLPSLLLVSFPDKTKKHQNHKPTQPSLKKHQKPVKQPAKIESKMKPPKSSVKPSKAFNSHQNSLNRNLIQNQTHFPSKPQKPQKPVCVNSI